MAGTEVTGRRPVVVVDDLHVKYRVHAGGRAAIGAAGRAGLLTRARGIRTVHALRGVTFTAYENESIGVTIWPFSTQLSVVGSASVFSSTNMRWVGMPFGSNSCSAPAK